MPYYQCESKDKYANKNSKRVFSGKINNSKNSCASFPIYEEEIKPLLFEVFRNTKDILNAMPEEYACMYKK
ncbi:MAG: hypothetical protein Q4B50_07750 [Bacillota bacterium]|nr:hypothetical protein [Bacillota bacterium]